MHQFRLCVNTYHGNYRMRSFSCLDQFLCMAFAQLSYREGPGDIESCSRAMQDKLYHIGIKARVSKSTLAYAHENRDWRIYTDFAQALNSIAQDLYANEDFVVELDETVYALDASTIDLCLTHVMRVEAISISLPQHRPRNNNSLHLRGAFIDLREFGIAKIALHRILHHVPVAAEDLDAPG